MCWCSNVSLIFINIHEGNGLLSESTRPYLNQCWLTICGTIWNTPKYSFHRNAFLYLLLSKCIWILSLAKTHFAPQSVSWTQPGTLWALMNDIIYFSLTNRKEGAYIIPIIPVVSVQILDVISDLYVCFLGINRNEWMQTSGCQRSWCGSYHYNLGIALQWHHDECNDISNHWHLACLFGHRWSKKTSKLYVTDLCEGNPQWQVDSLTKGQLYGKWFHLIMSSWAVSNWCTHYGVECNGVSNHGQSTACSTAYLG